MHIRVYSNAAVTRLTLDLRTLIMHLRISTETRYINEHIQTRVFRNNLKFS